MGKTNLWGTAALVTLAGVGALLVARPVQAALTPMAEAAAKPVARWAGHVTEPLRRATLYVCSRRVARTRSPY